MFRNSGGNIHTLFFSECNNFFDWQSLALLYSFNNSKQLGNITRLLACSDYKSYDDILKYNSNTFVHKNMRNDPTIEEKGYPLYNKPYSLVSFFENMDIKEEYIIVLDSDMIIRKPIDPKKLGVKRGTVVSSDYPYLVGADNNFKNRFLDTNNKIYKVGGFYIFHIDDLKKIAPLWLSYTKKIRKFISENEELFINESMETPEYIDENIINQAKWHAEMYGYIFAASHLNIHHIVTKDIVLYTGYEPYLQLQPYILHYGIDYSLGNIFFNKKDYNNLDIKDCNLFLFDNIDLHSYISKKDSISIENIAHLNLALCSFYEQRCEKKCVPEYIQKNSLDIEYIYTNWDCNDQNINCELWALKGECISNKEYMENICTKSCNLCQDERSSKNYILIFIASFFSIILIKLFVIKIKIIVAEKEHIV